MRNLKPAFLTTLSFIALSFFSLTSWGQIEDPAHWSIDLYESVEEGKIDLVFKCKLDKGWKVYSQKVDPMNGPMPTYFDYSVPEGIEKPAEVNECEPLLEYDPNFMVDLLFFKKTAYYWATLDLNGVSETDSISGFYSFMVCNDEMCLPPTDVDFKISATDIKAAADRPDYCKKNKPEGDKTGDEEEGLIWIFLMGFGIGLAALFTPCVFPMIPMTVSFFTKTSKTKSAGIRNALLYGFFIIFIYTGLGLALTAFFGVDVMNVISTDPYFNVFLFLLLMIFGASFLGAFEIQLPQSWANKADKASNRGGVIGIFFMAATLAIVSFSCTGPLVGGALAGAATGSFAAPTAVMLGFSIALALPFMFFSAFPGYLNSLPTSGGWLNNVKVVLGLVEIGFAFKFLSNADLVLQLGLLQRELFIAIWVAVCLAIAIYLFGWITLPHDSKTERIGVFRFSTGLVFLTLSIYLLPGIWGAPVNLISGFPPPAFYSEWSGGNHGSTSDSSDGHTGGHVEALYRDYDEGIEAAIAEGKPMLLDFTGWACVNCRKMEEQVWTDSRVAKILTEDVVLVSLYVDDRTELPEDEWRIEEYGEKEFNIKTIGKKWSYMQAANYNRNAQPYYVMVDHNGDQIGKSAGYDSNPDVFIDYLKDALKHYKRHR